MKQLNEAFGIALMEPDSGLFEDIEVFRGARPFLRSWKVGRPLGEFAHELEALGFAAGEGGAGLAKSEVAQSRLHHEPEHVAEAGCGRRKSPLLPQNSFRECPRWNGLSNESRGVRVHSGGPRSLRR